MRPARHPSPLRHALWLSAALLTGCVVLPPAEPGPQVVYPRTTPAAIPTLHFHAARGQSPAQQDHDRYACHVWATQQTGFDPSLPSLATHQRIDVVVTSPGAHGRSNTNGAARGSSPLDEQAAQFRRAMIACLQGRGYSLH